MSGTVWVSIHKLQQLTCRSVEWHWVGRRTNAVECIFAFGIGVELPSKIVISLLIVLLLVQTWDLSVKVSKSRLNGPIHHSLKLARHQFPHSAAVSLSRHPELHRAYTQAIQLISRLIHYTTPALIPQHPSEC